jgi:hypothetical protein
MPCADSKASQLPGIDGKDWARYQSGPGPAAAGVDGGKGEPGGHGTETRRTHIHKYMTIFGSEFSREREARKLLASYWSIPADDYCRCQRFPSPHMNIHRGLFPPTTICHGKFTYLTNEPALRQRHERALWPEMARELGEQLGE